MDQVLVVTEVYYPEQFLINDIVKHWNAQGKSVEVLTRNPAYPYGRIFNGYRNTLYSSHKEDGVRVHRYHIVQGYKEKMWRRILNYIWNTVLASFLMLLFHRKQKNIFVYHTGPLTVAFPAILLKKFNKAKVTIWTQDLWPDVVFAFGIRKNKLTKWILEKFVSFVYNNADFVITTSKQMSTQLARYTPNPLYYIHNWPMDEFANRMERNDSSKNNAFVFTFAGNVGYFQNLDMVILAFHQWSHNSERVELHIYGDGTELSTLQKLVEENNILNVLLHGRVHMAQMPEVYEQSDTLLISLREDEIFKHYIPAKFSTYLTAGKPVLAILTGAVAEMVDSTGIGYVADPHDAESIMEGFKKCLLLTPAEKTEIQNKEAKLFADQFHPGKSLLRLSEFVFS